MNLRSSHAVSRLLLVAGLVLAAMIGGAATWWAPRGGDGVQIVTATVAILVLLLAIVLSGVVVYRGVLRVPARARMDRIRESVPRDRVWLVDVDAALRAWVRAHPIVESAAIPMSRFGAAVSADEHGLIIWGGRGRVPAKAAAIGWAHVAEIRPPAAADLVGAAAPQAVIVFRLTAPDPELRILFLLDAVDITATGDVAEARRVVEALDELRVGDPQGDRSRA